MKKFVLDDESLLYGFLDEMDISYVSIFQEAIQSRFPVLTSEETDQLTERFWDELDMAMGDSDIRNLISAESYEEKEVEESTGLWGHFFFEIRDVDQTCKYYEDELKAIMTELVENLITEGKLNPA
jgi:hypothetical protein